MIDLSQEEILAIYLSLKIAFTASLVSLPLAIFLGYLFARKEFLFKRILHCNDATDGHIHHHCIVDCNLELDQTVAADWNRSSHL